MRPMRTSVSAAQTRDGSNDAIGGRTRRDKGYSRFVQHSGLQSTPPGQPRGGPGMNGGRTNRDKGPMKARAPPRPRFTRGNGSSCPRPLHRDACPARAVCRGERVVCREYRRDRGPDGAGNAGEGRRRPGPFACPGGGSARRSENGFYIVTIMECRLRPTSINKDCNIDETYPLSLTGNQAQGVTQANGTGNAFIDIQSTARLPALACSHTNPCSLLVFENPPEGTDYEHLPTAYATVKLDFRQERRRLSRPRVASTSGWRPSHRRPRRSTSGPPTLRGFRAVRPRRDQHFVDCGAPSVLREARRCRGVVGAAAAARSPRPLRPFLVAPVDLTAVVVAYVIVDPVTGQQITDLTLSPRLVARLVSDSDVLTLFNDPEFQKLNPRHTFPPQTRRAGSTAPSRTAIRGS